MSELVTIERRGLPSGDVAVWITMRRERQLNALDAAQTRRLTDAFTGLADDAGVRAVVLTGTGRGFIGGADIDELGELDEASGRRFISSLHRLCTAIRGFPMPTIAAINGFCLGGGLEIAAACDLRVAADSARFGMPEVHVGLPSVIEAALLPRLVGWGKAAEIVLTAAQIDAGEAERIGLVQRVVPAAELSQAAEAWLADLDAAGPNALRAQKALLRQWEREPLDRAVAAGIQRFAEVCRTGEPARMVAAFKAARAARKAKG